MCEALTLFFFFLHMYSEVNVTLPDSTHRNGSLYAHIFLGPEGKSPLHRNDWQYMSVMSVPITRYAVPEATSYSLLTTMSEVCLQ